MTLRSSPTTSEIARQTVGPDAAAARRPPFTADRCLRIVLSAVISAPPFSSALTAVRLSSSVSAPAGTAINAEAPPESSTTSVSSGIGALRDLERAPARCDAALIRQRMARWNPLQVRRQRNRQVRADDDAVANAIAGDRRKRVGHERRRLADGNHAQVPATQARRDCRILHGAIDEMMWRRGLDGAACDVRKCWRKCDRTEISVNVLRIGPARQARHHVELPQQAADDLIGVFFG